MLPGRGELQIAGLFTTLVEDRDFDSEQMARFSRIITAIRELGIDPGICHAASSAAVIGGETDLLDMVRVGNGFYGFEPQTLVDTSPILSFHTRVIMVKTLYPGDSIAYHRRTRVTQEMRVATLPIGYSDGYPFNAIDKGAEVLIRGRRFPLIVYMSANHVTVDITDAPEIEIGDEVILFGQQGDQAITITEVAAWGNSSEYKVTTNISPLTPRIFRTEVEPDPQEAEAVAFPAPKPDPKHPVQQAYEIWSATYDSQDNPTRDLSARLCRQFLPAGPHTLIVEAGCGTGLNTDWLAAQTKDLIGFDFSDSMLAIARAKVTARNISLSQHDIREPWPAPAGQADVVTINLVLEHVDNLAVVIQSAARVLRTGGNLLITEYHPYRVAKGQGAQVERADGEVVLEISNFHHPLSEYQALATAHGFTIKTTTSWQSDAAGNPVQTGDDPLIALIIMEKTQQ